MSQHRCVSELRQVSHMPTELKSTFQAKSNTATNNTSTRCYKTFVATQIIK